MIIEVLISGGAGLELCRFFRQHDGTAIVVVSAVQAMDAAIDAGADAFLRKPIDPLQLVSTVRDLLRSSALLTGRSSCMSDGRLPAGTAARRGARAAVCRTTGSTS